MLSHIMVMVKHLQHTGEVITLSIAFDADAAIVWIAKNGYISIRKAMEYHYSG